ITGPRYLIINADDFGLSDGVTGGIIKAWQEGVVTSTSAMINIAGAPERIAAARAAHPNLPIGLHLNTTAGRPVLPPEQVPTLVDETGRFHNRFTVFQHLHKISLAELRAELHAQAERLLSTGVQFDHIDYHQHLMVMHTPFYPLVCELARRYQVPVRQPVPEAFYRHIRLKGRPGNGAVLQTVLEFATQYPNLAVRMVPSVMPATYKKQAALLDNEGIRTTNWLVTSLYDKATVDNFISVLRQLPPGVSEMVMHPAIPDEQLQLLGGNYIEQRADELAMLTDPRLRQAFKEYHVTPVDFSFVRTWSQ
ncbi:MAG: carbohydrate deacetylase, partial [Anaerolineae bacterium]